MDKLIYEVKKLITTIETELDKYLNDLKTESQEIVGYNNSKDNDIEYLESILTQNMNRNNQMKGTVFLYDQRMAVLEETYSDLTKKLSELKVKISIPFLIMKTNAISFLKTLLRIKICYRVKSCYLIQGVSHRLQ